MSQRFSQNTQTLKEFKWYNSYSVPTELQCGICRLELPVDVQIQGIFLEANDLWISAQVSKIRF
jgi:hypothetical protein